MDGFYEKRKARWRDAEKARAKVSNSGDPREFVGNLPFCPHSQTNPSGVNLA